MALSFQRFMSAGILTVWGVLLTYFFASGRVGSYLHPAFHGWMLVCGIVLLLMAVGLLLLPEVNPVLCGDEPSTTRPGIGKQLVTGTILVIPLLVATVVSPSQFGAAVVKNRGIVEDISDLPGYQPYTEPALPTADGSLTASVPTASSPADYIPKTAEGLIKAQTVDLMYAAQDESMRKDFENKDVEIVGQFMPGRKNNASGDRFSLVSMFVMCCAADARPVAVNVQTPSPTSMADMSWVKVTGKVKFPVEGGRTVPVVIAESVQPCDPPEESFIY